MSSVQIAAQAEGSAPPIQDDVRTCPVAVIGFSASERVALGSIFGLSARRSPRFVPFLPNEHKAPELYLIDADDERCDAYLKAITAKGGTIALIGASARGTSHPIVPRPLMWTRILKLFDDALRLAPGPLAAATKTDRVLVVDDSLAVRKFMESRLSLYGFDVDYAASGEEAVSFAAAKKYTCVFLDVILPGMDGYQVCKLVKKSRSRTSIVMLTSKSSPFDRIRGTMAGCDAYLTKPVDEEKLLEAIAKFVPVHAPIPTTV